MTGRIGPHEVQKRVVLLEFTRVMDTNNNIQSVTERRRTDCYLLHCKFIASVLNSHTVFNHNEKASDIDEKAWSVTEINFTVGLRGLLHEKSFKAALTWPWC